MWEYRVGVVVYSTQKGVTQAFFHWGVVVLARCAEKAEKAHVFIDSSLSSTRNT